MEQDLSGKSALVTGSSSGIGRAMALRLARSGAAVTINHSGSSSAGASSVLRKIEEDGGKAQVVEADVTVESQLEDLVGATERFGGGLDIVCANAGGDLSLTPIAEVDLAHWDRSTWLNQRSVLHLFKLVAQRMRDGGRVIATSSSATADPYPGTAVYSGAKAAIEVYVRVLARELGPRKITVNAISPGLTQTASMLASVPEARRALVIARTPLGRLGTPEDIADVVGFLAGESGRWITGQNIRAGGGIV